MNEVLWTKAKLLAYLNSNKFIRHIKEEGFFIEWDQPHQEFYYIEHKRIPTFITPKEVNALHKSIYGKQLPRNKMDSFMNELGFEASKLGQSKIYRDCIISPCL